MKVDRDARTDRVLHTRTYEALYAAHHAEAAIGEARGLICMLVEHLDGRDRTDALRSLSALWLENHGA